MSLSWLRTDSFHGVIFDAGVSVMGMNVTFSFARYNFETCDFMPGVINISRVKQQCYHMATSVSCKRLCQFILDLIKCRNWYGSDDECILDKDGIFEITKFLAAG